MKTAQDFIEFFEKIPSKKWIQHRYVNPDDPSCKCAIGHLIYDDNGEYQEGGYYQERTLRLILNTNPAWVNDGLHEFESFGSTPKKRIINALKRVENLASR